jgi:hypothetical protein
MKVAHAAVQSLHLQVQPLLLLVMVMVHSAPLVDTSKCTWSHLRTPFAPPAAPTPVTHSAVQRQQQHHLQLVLLLVLVVVR